MKDKDQLINLSYDEAMEELQGIVIQLQSDNTSIDQLSGRVLRAKLLANYCKDKLRTIQNTISDLDN
jgi:exodeoxyribonuclease VII small subunit